LTARAISGLATFIVGAQNQDALWDGNLSEFAPNGRPLSPMTTGFTGGGIEGVGYGLAIDADDSVWVTTSGSQTIAKFDNQGKPLSPPEGYNFNHQLGLMQGIIVTPSGDVWVVGVSKNQLVYFPGGTRQGQGSSAKAGASSPANRSADRSTSQ
jgi:streptogramin lyase